MKNEDVYNFRGSEHYISCKLKNPFCEAVAVSQKTNVGHAIGGSFNNDYVLF